MYSFFNPVKVYFGEGAAIPAFENEMPAVGNKVLLAYGGGSVKRNGVYDQIVGLLKQHGKEIIEFSGITPNPRYTEVQACACLARENHVDLMLAVGGGSVIDCVRTAAVQALLDEDIWEYEIAQGNKPAAAIPMGIVLTLGGTGSDMNYLAGINYEEKKEKVTFTGKHALFDIIDPNYTKSVPMKQLLTGAFDTLSHYMETYFGNGNFVSDELMETLMCNTIRNAKAIKADPNNDAARSELLWASTLALSGLPSVGKTKDFQCHRIEHWISGMTDANHGMTLAVLHPIVYRHICTAAPEKFARFASKVMELSCEGRSTVEMAYAGIDALEAFIHEIGLPSSFAEMGLMLDDSTIRDIANHCTPSTGCCMSLSHDEFYEILTACMHQRY